MASKTLFHPEFTVFTNLKQTHKKSTRDPMGTVLSCLKYEDGLVYDRVMEIRELSRDKEKNKKAIRALKEKLPLACFNGVFTHRHHEGFIKHSGLMVTDFDNYPTGAMMQDDLEWFKNDPHSFLVFVSPSGKGFKVVVRIPLETTMAGHVNIYQAYAKYCNKDQWDSVNSDIVRACFLSIDPDFYYNQHAMEFGGKASKLDQLCNNIREARQGEKQKARLNNAITAGGYIAAGRWDRDETVQALMDAAMDNTDDEKLAAGAIESGIRMGLERPIHEISGPNTPPSKDKPIEIDEVQEELPEIPYIPFPVEVFPEWVQDHMTKSEKYNDMVPDFMATSFLFAVSTSIGGRFKTHNYNGWMDRPMIWAMCVGGSGKHKSPSMKAMTGKLREITGIKLVAFLKHLAEYMAKKQKDRDPNDKPQDDSILLGDITVPALLEKLAGNPRGFGIYMDEIHGLFAQLSHNSEYRSKYLTGFNGEMLRSSTKTQGEIFVAEAFWSLMGSIQSAVLTDAIKDKNQESGLIPRFLLAMPKDVEGRTKRTREISTENFLQKYNDRFGELYARINHLGFNGNPKVINLTPEAITAAMDFNDYLTEYHNSDETTIAEREFVEKANIYVYRIATILAIVWNDERDLDIQHPVEVEHVTKAISVVKYYMNNVKRVFESVEIARELEGVLKHRQDKKSQAKFLWSKGTRPKDIQRICRVNRQTEWRWRNEFKKDQAAMDNLNRLNGN